MAARPAATGMLLPLAETLEYNDRPGADRAVIQVMAHTMAIAGGVPDKADDLIPAANRTYRRATEGCAAAQRLVDIAKDMLPEVVLRDGGRGSLLDDIKEAHPDATVSVAFADGATHLCSQLAEKMEAESERATAKKLLEKR